MNNTKREWVVRVFKHSQNHAACLFPRKEVFYYADTRPIEDNRDERKDTCDKITNVQLVLGCV